MGGVDETYVLLCVSCVENSLRYIISYRTSIYVLKFRIEKTYREAYWWDTGGGGANRAVEGLEGLVSRPKSYSTY